MNKILATGLAIGVMVLGSAGLAAAQTGSPRVAIQLATTGLTSPLTASSTNATVARLILDTTGSTEPVRISSLPFILTVGNGAQASTLFNCRVFNEANPSVALSASTTMQSGLNSIALSAPIDLAANTVTVLALRCDVASNLATGGTFTFSMNTGSLSAVGATTGLPAVVTVRGAAVTTPPVVTPTTPGIPATGGGPDEARNNSLMIIIGSLLAATLGASLIVTRRSEDA